MLSPSRQRSNGFQGASVLLRKTDGATIAVKVARLSDSDQKYVAGIKSIAAQIHFRGEEMGRTTSTSEACHAADAVWACQRDVVTASGGDSANMSVDDALLNCIVAAAERVCAEVENKEQTLSFGDACRVAAAAWKCQYMIIVAQDKDSTARRSKMDDTLLDHIVAAANRILTKGNEQGLTISLGEASEIVQTAWNCQFMVVAAQDGNLETVRIDTKLLDHIVAATSQVLANGEELGLRFSPTEACGVVAVTWDCQFMVAVLQDQDLGEMQIDGVLLDHIVTATNVIVTHHKNDGGSVPLAKVGGIISGLWKGVVKASVLSEDNASESELAEALLEKVKNLIGEKVRTKQVAVVPPESPNISPREEPTTTSPEPANEPQLPGSYKNMIGMQFKLMPAGEFMMGSPADDPDTVSDQMPQHRVRITKPFYLGIYEVTQEQYEKVMDKNPSHFKGPSLPVETVTWEDATDFCKKLSEMDTDYDYRLPTEAEWEYACRAGTTTRYNCGDELDVDCAWFQDNSERTTHPVGKKSPNAWGLYDLHGNVWEWCQDLYDRDRYNRGYYGNSPSDDPTGPSTGSSHVNRGGCWFYAAKECRSAFRGKRRSGDRGYDVGFRVALVSTE